MAHNISSASNSKTGEHISVSNLVINLNKVRGANKTKNPEKSVLMFNYFAPESTQINQRPLVRVIKGSLQKSKTGKWFFKAINLYRINDQGKGTVGAIRSYLLDNINGIVQKLK